MQISSVHIKNLRSVADETIHFDRYTCLVGANGAGKSTILCALNIFFRETEGSIVNLSRLEPEDFHQKNTATPIEITVTFKNLSPQAQRDFADYYRQDALIVTARAVYEEVAGAATVKQWGNRLGMKDFSHFFERLGDGAKATELKSLFLALKEQFPGIDDGSSMADMAAALRKYEAERPGSCELIPSEDEFYGVSQGKGLLRKYVQWIYVPAVKDAASEQAEGKNTALGKLLARTVRSKVDFSTPLQVLRDEAEEKYRSLLTKEQGILNEISETLQERLAEWSHPDATAKLEWQQDQRTSVRIEEPFAHLVAGDGEFEGQIARFGHGLQRSYIIALLHGLAAIDQSNAPSLILGIEEPELYQHPPQARHLSDVLHTLSEANSQIIVSTHSPFFVGGKGFENVRMVRKDRAQKRSVVRQLTIDELSARTAATTGNDMVPREGALAKLHQALQPNLSEMFFTNRLVLCEGLEDVAYVNAWMLLSNRLTVLRKYGCHIVPVGGKSEILQPLIIADALDIPTFVFFDADGDKLNHNDQNVARSRRVLHERDNLALLKALGSKTVDAFPSATEWGDRFAMWPTDIGKISKEECGEQAWDTHGQVASVELGGVSGLQKNTLHIGARLRAAHNDGVVLQSLDSLCEKILDFCAKN